MNRPAFLGLFVFLSFSGACLGQSAQNDSQTLQSLLAEVRHLRQDLQTTTLTAQRTHILIYRLQRQEATVARASQRLDEAREMLSGAQSEKKRLAAEIKQHEEFIRNAENPPAQRKEFENRLAEDKARLEMFETQEQQLATRESEADQQLRAEESRLSDLRDQLDRFDKTLEDATQRLGGNPQ